MGVMVRWQKPEENSSWTNVVIMRATSETGVYSDAKTLGIAFTEWFDEDGSDDYWYKIRFKNTETGKDSDPSDPMQGGVYPYYATPSDIYHFAQLTTIDETNRPTVGEILTWIRAAHIEITQDTDATDTDFLWLLTNNLASSYVMRALAHKALVQGYISFNIEGVSFQKPYSELQQESRAFKAKYKELLHKFQTEGVITKPLRNVESQTRQDIVDTFHGTSDGYDYQAAAYPSYKRRRPYV